MSAQEIPVYPGVPRFEWTPVDLVGQHMIAVDQRDRPSVPTLTDLFEGPLDFQAYEESVDEVARLYPSITSTLVAVGPVFRQRLGWRHGTNDLPVTFVDRRSEGLPAGDPGDWLPDVDSNCDPVYIDLAVEAPMRIRVTSFSDNWHAITHIYHHALGDGAFFVEFNTNVQARYHEKVTGTFPDWAQRNALHSTVTAVPIKETDVETWGNYLARSRAWLNDFPETEIAQVAGTEGRPGSLVAIHRIGDQKLLSTLRRRCRGLGATMTDLAVAAAARATDRWNASRGAESNAHVHSVLVNLRGLRPPQLQGVITNDILGCPIATRPADRRDLENLVRTAAAQRRDFFDSGRYIRELQLTNALAKLVSTLPVASRIRLIGMWERRLTMSVSNLGVLRPEVRSGTVSAGPRAHKVGELEHRATVIHANTPASNPQLLGMQQTELGTDLFLSGNRADCTLDELRSVLDLITDELEEFGS